MVSEPPTIHQILTVVEDFLLLGRFVRIKLVVIIRYIF